MADLLPECMGTSSGSPAEGHSDSMKSKKPEALTSHHNLGVGLMLQHVCLCCVREGPNPDRRPDGLPGSDCQSPYGVQWG